MLIGLAVFVVPNRIAQIVIGLGALAGAYGLFAEHPADPWVIGVNIFTGLALLASAGCAMMALDRAGLPAGCGAPPSLESLTKRGFLGMPREMMVYVGALLAVPVFTLFVSGFSFFTADGQPYQLISEKTVKSMKSGEGALAPVIATVVEEVSKPAGLVLFLVGLISLIYLGKHIVKLERIARHRMIVAMILIFFSMLFWAFFEQAGSSINNFTDRNVDRMTGGTPIVAADVGKTIEIQPTQGQLGFSNGPKMFTLDQLDELRAAAAKNNDSIFKIPWTVAQDNVGMLVSNRSQEIPASTFQSVNAICVLIFGLVLTALWTWMAKRRIEPSTPLKFALGLLQVGLGFYALVLGAQSADGRGMVAVGWLVLGYALHTTGELCVSPVGLSMVTKLSPKFLVSTVMGTWFLATAFSQYLASIISIFTSVKEGGGASDSFPTPIQTLGNYSGVFENIAIAAGVSAAICLALVPLLKAWMHEGEDGADAAAPRGGH
jgi:dipeptide/tripeptide permease